MLQFIRSCIVNFIKKCQAYTSVGCYASSNICNWSDVFVEKGISSTQCSNFISIVSEMECFKGKCEYQWVRSNSSMTVEKCLQMCVSNGFKYAGIDT